MNRTHAAPLTRITGTSALKLCKRAIVTIPTPAIITPAETIVSVEKRARSFYIIKAPPIEPAPKHPSNTPYPMALSFTPLATDGSSANSVLEKNMTMPGTEPRQ
jgi:hypothetical protein